MDKPLVHEARSRRALLRAGAGLLIIGATPGCSALSTDPIGTGDASGSNSAKGKEAPSLKALVDSGDLPPVEQRLPKEPVVVAPADRVGRYGGTWTTAYSGAADIWWLSRTIGYESLLRWTPEWERAEPNVAESVEMSPDGRTFTITLREGLRWSDGESVTSDDILFAVKDVFLNVDYSPAPPTWLTTSDGTPARAEKRDDLTVTLTFEAPKPMLPAELASWGGRDLVSYPRHYLKKFHPNYAKSADQRAEKAGFSTWTELFDNRADLGVNADLPRLHPWLVKTGIGDEGRIVAERNPYYFKVDPDGSQLPYIDKVEFDLINDPQVMLLRATDGDFGFHARHFTTLENKPVLAKSREAGGYGFVSLKITQMNEMEIGLNLTHKDPVKREVFNNRHVRIGLSHAINREEIITSAFQRQGEPWQVAPLRGSRFFDEEFAKQYTDYDPDKANRHLDDAGYQRRDQDGFRLGPDGKRISFQLPVTSDKPNWPTVAEFISEYWADVGIDAKVNNVDRTLYWERQVANELDAYVWTADGGLNDEIQLSFGRHTGSSAGVLWQEWYDTRGESGVKPPAATRKQMEIYRRVLETPDQTEREDLSREFLEIAKEQFYNIGTVAITDGYGIVGNDFHNVPASMYENPGLYPNPGPTNPEQYFVE